MFFSDTGAFVNNSPKQLWRYTPSLRRGHWLRKSTPATRPAAQGGKSRTFWPKNGGFLMWILDCWRVDNYSRYMYIYVRVFSVAYSIQSLKKSDPDIWKEHISNQFFFRWSVQRVGMSTTLDASSTKIKPTASPNESSALKLNYLQVSEKKTIQNYQWSSISDLLQQDSRVIWKISLFLSLSLSIAISQSLARG